MYVILMLPLHLDKFDADQYIKCVMVVYRLDVLQSVCSRDKFVFTITSLFSMLIYIT